MPVIKKNGNIYVEPTPEFKGEWGFIDAYIKRIRIDMPLFKANKDFVKHVKDKFGITIRVLRGKVNGEKKIFFNSEDLTRIFHNQK